MVAHIEAQLAAAGTQKRPATPRKASAAATVPPGAVGAVGGKETAPEAEHPPGHRARYAIAQGGGLPYSGCRVVFDDIAPEVAQQLAVAARGLGIRAY